jgi:Tfp pilus assembly protein PilF/peroxiredoxin
MMERKTSKNLLKTLVFVILTQMFLPAVQGQSELRNVKVGEEMPEFSLPELNGNTFTYKHDRNKVVVLTFLPTSQRRMERAITDIEIMIKDLQDYAQQLDFVGVVSGSTAKDFQESSKKGPKRTFPILLDDQFHLWGKLGVIAAPTEVIVGKDDNILWIRAGFGYDFIPVVRAHIEQALGIVQETTVEQAQQVKAVMNNTIEARIQRHLQMAKILEKKGRVDSAISELHKAAQFDPNSIKPSLELGELLCRAGRNKDALNLTAKLRATNNSDKARLLLISGWARRQMGELKTAEKLLLEATKLDPTSIRTLFELGKVYQARKQTEKAMNSYYTALSLLFEESERMKFSK